jgi:hypothetical protein|tara:strand:+ start:904 stop:1110 length:207 start_codon:yes stop_codon:yes gene_type:complete
MDIEFTHELNLEQFENWCTFCLDNTIEMYENKDSYMNVWDREKEKYIVYIQRNEQSGIENFFNKMLVK